MKKVLKPFSAEEAVFYSDFSGKCFGSLVPIKLTIEFDYGSQFDGSFLSLDLDDRDVADLLSLIKSRITTDKKDELLSKREELEQLYQESSECRDWGHCDQIFGHKSLNDYLTT